MRFGIMGICGGRVSCWPKATPSSAQWEQNTAKSKYSLGPAPQSRTLTFEAQGGGVKASAEMTAGDGSHVTFRFTANYGGKDNRFQGRE